MPKSLPHAAPVLAPVLGPVLAPAADFSQPFGIPPAVQAMPVPRPLTKPAPAGPMAEEIRRINSAHQPEVREVASDEVLGREIADADARQLAAQNKSVRRQQRRRTP